MRKRVKGRVINRFCDSCGRWCDRSNRSRLWTELTGHRTGNQKEEPMYCCYCLPPKVAGGVVVRLATLVHTAAADESTAERPCRPAERKPWDEKGQHGNGITR